MFICILKFSNANENIYIEWSSIDPNPCEITELLIYAFKSLVSSSKKKKKDLYFYLIYPI